MQESRFGARYLRQIALWRLGDWIGVILFWLHFVPIQDYGPAATIAAYAGMILAVPYLFENVAVIDATERFRVSRSVVVLNVEHGSVRRKRSASRKGSGRRRRDPSTDGLRWC